MNVNVISAFARPHLETGCWCGPQECPCCGEMSVHRAVDVRPDEQHRMAVFSDQRIQASV